MRQDLAKATQLAVIERFAERNYICVYDYADITENYLTTSLRI